MVRVPLRRLAAGVLAVLLCASLALPVHAAAPVTGSDGPFGWMDWLRNLAGDVTRALARAESPALAEPDDTPPPPAPLLFEDADLSGPETDNLPTVDPDG